MCEFEVKQEIPILRIALRGEWIFTTKKANLNALSALIAKASEVEIDFGLEPTIDFAFCALLKDILQHKPHSFINQNKRTQEIFTILEDFPQGYIPPKKPATFIDDITHFVRTTKEAFEKSVDFLNFTGLCLWRFFVSIAQPKRHFKVASIFYHIWHSGVLALPLVLVVSVIVSYVIAMQGAIQLAKMGTPILSVEIVSKLTLRELGPFVMALVIAGRSASAFTAQIGAMKITEENDALQSMGFDVIDYLITPRILALVLMMPLMVFLVDLVGLLAVMLALNVQAGISFTQFWERFYEFVNISHFLVGIAKAPFFGLAIALVGCYRGLRVDNDTESLGKETTASVVNAIFFIIFINAVFSFIVTALGV